MDEVDQRVWASMYQSGKAKVCMTRHGLRPEVRVEIGDNLSLLMEPTSARELARGLVAIADQVDKVREVFDVQQGNPGGSAGPGRGGADDAERPEGGVAVAGDD
jgi:hypothetical protein